MGAGGWLRRVGPWVAIGTSPGALMAGGGISDGAHGMRLVAAIVVGAVALGALAAIQGMLGQRTGKPLLALTAGPLGGVASRRTASVAMLAMMVGWYGLNTSVAGAGLGRLIGAPDRVGMIVFSFAVFAITWRGVDWLSWAALAAGCATVGLAAYGLVTVASQHDLSLHAAHVKDPANLVQGVALVVGYGAAFSLRTPDFTRDLSRPRQVVWCALAGLVAPFVAFALAGAVLALSTGTWNLANVLRALDSPTVAYLFVAVGFLGSVMTNLYSGALSLHDALPRLGHGRAMVAMALAGTALATTDFARWMLPYLTVMAVTAPALAAICWIHHLRRDPVRDDWNPRGVAAWAGGTCVGLGMYLAGSFLAVPAAVAVAAAAYALAPAAFGSAGTSPPPAK